MRSHEKEREIERKIKEIPFWLKNKKNLILA